MVEVVTQMKEKEEAKEEKKAWIAEASKKH